MTGARRRLTQHPPDRRLGEPGQGSESDTRCIRTLVDVERLDSPDCFQRCADPAGARRAPSLLHDELDRLHEVYRIRRAPTHVAAYHES